MTTARPILLLTVMARAAAHPGVMTLLVSGACDQKSFLNSLTFRRIAQGATGSPIYKADAGNEYLYYDPDCSAGGDGESRWILGSTEPSTTRHMDLDGDGICSYHARVDSTNPDHPPLTANWWMECGSSRWETRFVTLLEVTTTATSSTTTKSSTTTVSSTTPTSTRTETRTSTETSTSSGTTTSGTTTVSSTTTSGTETSLTSTAAAGETTVIATDTIVSSTDTSTMPVTSRNTATSTFLASLTSPSPSTTQSKSSAAATEPSDVVPTATPQADMVLLSGACEFKGRLNGIAFQRQGNTANGAPFFKSILGESYIYYDEDCNGGGHGVPRWVIDEDAPNSARSQDVDDDGACNYHARIDSADSSGPPTAAKWTMFCGSDWEEQLISLEVIVQAPDTVLVTTAAPTHISAETVRLTGMCEEKSYLNGVLLSKQGKSVDGAAFYKGVADGQVIYIYHDRACSGDAEGIARWILDVDEPDTQRLNDLDGDKACDYHARLNSEGLSLPSSATWHAYCGDRWKDVVLSLEEQTPPGHAEIPSQLYVSGACDQKAFLNGLILKWQGVTASGAPFYAGTADGHDIYLYHDRSCDGGHNRSARWILDVDAPHNESTSDLDNDQDCDYHARFESEDAESPPASASWHMHCGEAWLNVSLALDENETVAVAVSTNSTSLGTTTMQGVVTAGAKEVSYSLALILLAIVRTAA